MLPPSRMKVDKKLLAIKGHYFFFNAGTAPLVPYLSSYARQLGFSSATVGIIYTVLPIFGLVAKPLFGVIADRFKIQKSLFLLFQIVTIISFSAIYFIPSNVVNVELDCGDGVTVLKKCYNTTDLINSTPVDMLGKFKPAAYCDMTCDMKSSKMWQTVCEHWHMPQYCYSSRQQIEHKAFITNITIKDDHCAYAFVNNVTLDGYVYTPHCRIDKTYKDINEPCTVKCSNAKLAAAISNEKLRITCTERNMNYRLCSNNIDELILLSQDPVNSECEVTCDLENSAPWELMEICEGWHADVAKTCQPMLSIDLPSSLSFKGSVLVSSLISEHNCIYAQMPNITMANGSVRHPTCVGRPEYQNETHLFQTSCSMNCDNEMLTHIYRTDSTGNANSEYTMQFWLFFLLMIASWIGQAVVVTFADAICFNLLGPKVQHYGKQRLWGSVGWGIFSLLTGVLIDQMSDGEEYKNYAIAFILMFVFMCGDVIVSCFLRINTTKMSLSILTDVSTLLWSLRNFIFILWTIAVGLCTGLLWQFLFWLIEDTAALSGGSPYVKTLQGLVSAIQTFGGEIPFLFVSGYVLKKIGHVNMMSIVLLAFGVRFILYSLLTNPWWVLPIEMFQGITFGMFYPTLTSYATIVSPPGTETTVQGLVGAVFEGVGTSLGSFIGGRLYDTYGGSTTFLSFGIGSLVCCAIHALAHFILKDRLGNIMMPEGYATVIRYEHPNDMIYMLEDMNEEK